MIFGPPQLTKRGSDLWKLFSIRLSSRAFTFCSFWICDERRGFGLLYRHLAVFGLFTDLKLSTCLGFPFLSGFSAGVTVRYNLGFVMVSTVRPNLIWRYDGDRWLSPFLIDIFPAIGMTSPAPVHNRYFCSAFGSLEVRKKAFNGERGKGLAFYYGCSFCPSSLIGDYDSIHHSY